MQRSISLDILKLFLCLFIIAIHLYPLFGKDSLAGWFIVNGYARTAVPVFLLINGYFLSSKIENKSAVKQYIKHLLIVYAVWSAFYAQYYITWESPAKILINLLTGYHHLWYLPALMVGVIMLYFVRKIKLKDTHILILAITLYIIGHQLALHRLFVPIVRNGVFYGFMFIALGYLLYKYKIENYFKLWHLIILFVIGLLLLSFETSIYYKLAIEMDIFLVSLIISPVIFIFCLKYPLLVNKSTATEYFGYIPTGIYYVHLFYVYKFYSVDYNIYNVPIVFILSALTVIPLVYLNKRVKIFL